MMAQQGPSATSDKKRVKVYELRNNDWFDRGTGFCVAAYDPVPGDDLRTKEPRVLVESEDEPSRLLLETHISKEDAFQKQQDTLIVWTEPSNGVDMALSFQEADGCAMIWKFITTMQHAVQNHMINPDDSQSDDLAMDISGNITLPPIELSNLPELEAGMRMMTSTAHGRDILGKSILSEDYIKKFIPLVDDAEDLETLPSLHHLCNIMKIILLLNDTGIIEHAVSDDCVLGVVGALEYDPDFPSHKANHRQWLSNQGRFKEVVRIQDEQIRHKIHQTYRLQYLKDVVLARILDDPTFSVLNSLIFFNQVDIVQHLQSNSGFLMDLFDIFAEPHDQELLRKKEAVLFIQQCCAIAKNLQPPARLNLYSNFLQHGLLQVIDFGLRSHDVAVRVGATDILVSMIDHDPQMIRATILRQVTDRGDVLLDTLIDLLLVEVDLGIKSQISDALKVLLDPSPTGQPPQEFASKAITGEYQRLRQLQAEQNDPQRKIIQYFYDHSAVRLFKPLIDLEGQENLKFSALDDGIFGYLNEILCFNIRHHGSLIRFFILQKDIPSRFAQLLDCREKHLQLVAVRFFRTLAGLMDQFYTQVLIEKHILGPVLDLLIRTLPRDNLLSSACLELFELVRKDNIKPMVKELLEKDRDKVQSLSYIETFRELIVQGDRPHGYGVGDHLTMDADEEAYWNTSDDEEENHPVEQNKTPSWNGASTPSKPLVDYPSDDEADENADTEMGPAPAPAGPDEQIKTEEASSERSGEEGALSGTPPERVSEKRRREEDEEEDLGKVLQHKRRNSSSASMNVSAANLRKKKGFAGRDASGNGPQKMAITISPLKASAGRDEDAG